MVEATDISWKTAASEGGVTAVLNGNVLTLQGVEGANRPNISIRTIFTISQFIAFAVTKRHSKLM